MTRPAFSFLVMNSQRALASPVSDLDPRRWIGFMVISSATLLSVLDFLIVVIALPAIQASIGTTEAQIQLTIAGYGLAFAAFLITGGRLGDIYGRRLIFQIGMFGFTAASALCGFAQTPNQLIVFRVIQGFWAAFMAPQVLATVQVAFSGRKRDKATGIFGATVGIGSFLGNLLGGYLVAANLLGLGWRAIFFVNVPIGIAAILLSFLYVPESKAPTAKKLDIVGALISVVALFLLIYPIAEGREQSFPLWAFAMIGASGVAFYVFVCHQKWLDKAGGSPLVNMELFQSGGFRNGLIGIGLLYSGLATFSLPLTLFFQKGMGVKPEEVGVIFSALSISFLIASLGAVKLVARIGTKTLLLGLGMMQIAQLALIAVSLYTHGELNPFLLMPILFLYGSGQGLSLPQVVRQTLNQVGANSAGTASGILSTVQQVALSLGSAVVGGVFFYFAEKGESTQSYTNGLAAAFACNFLIILLARYLLANNFKRQESLRLNSNEALIVEA
jgi:EmrB/QacA subfamily drug resistance transporter